MSIQHRFASLDGWRGLAALAVVVLHSSFLGHASEAPFVRNSYLFVDFFFVLSGFVITYLAYQLFQAHHHRFEPIRDTTAAEVLVTLGIVAFVTYAEPTVTPLLAPLAFSVLVLVFALQRGAMSRMLMRTPFRQFGDWSFAIYMIHALLAVIALRIATVVEKLTGMELRIDQPALTGQTPEPRIFFADALAMDLMTVLYVLAVIGLSALSFRYLETPSRRYFNQLARRRETGLH